MNGGHCNWLELDAHAIASNLAAFRARLGEHVQIGAVVKSNAYGHGMREVAGIAADHGADWLCVNNVDEGAQLREWGHERPIVILGYVPLGALDRVVAHDLRPVVYNPETLDRLEALAAAANRVVPVHVKVETGTNRQGVQERDMAAFVARIRASAHLRLEGLCTHFANIEDTTNHAFADAQIATFERVQALAGPVAIRHAACSAAAVLFDRTHLDLARIGISLYGLWSSKETQLSSRERGTMIELTPALTWKTRIAQVKDVAEGAYVGYGCSHRTTRQSRIAVLPVGYYEGYDRGISNVGHVLLRGKRAPIRGRICMNMCMIDVTDIPDATLEDEVVLLGSHGEERVSAEQLAAWCGTIAYEIVARIHPALPRIVV